MRLAGLERLFRSDRVLFREDSSRPKPHPDVYLASARCLGINAQALLVFEDSIPGVTAARVAGARVVAVPTVFQPEYISRLALAGAQRIYSSWRAVDCAAILSES
jgi:beta-phosphoglucomutase-like phosphatase (HAD superfamily)